MSDTDTKPTHEHGGPPMSPDGHPDPEGRMTSYAKGQSPEELAAGKAAESVPGEANKPAEE